MHKNICFLLLIILMPLLAMTQRKRPEKVECNNKIKLKTLPEPGERYDPTDICPGTPNGPGKVEYTLNRCALKKVKEETKAILLVKGQYLEKAVWEVQGEKASQELFKFIRKQYGYPKILTETDGRYIYRWQEMRAEKGPVILEFRHNKDRSKSTVHYYLNRMTK